MLWSEVNSNNRKGHIHNTIISVSCCNWIKVYEAGLLAMVDAGTHVWALLSVVEMWPDRGTKMRRPNLHRCHSCGSNPPYSCYRHTVASRSGACPGASQDLVPKGLLLSMPGTCCVEIHERQPQQVSSAQLQPALRNGETSLNLLRHWICSPGHTLYYSEGLWNLFKTLTCLLFLD